MFLLRDGFAPSIHIVEVKASKILSDPYGFDVVFPLSIDPALENLFCLLILSNASQRSRKVVVGVES